MPLTGVLPSLHQVVALIPMAGLETHAVATLQVLLVETMVPLLPAVLNVRARVFFDCGTTFTPSRRLGIGKEEQAGVFQPKISQASATSIESLFVGMYHILHVRRKGESQRVISDPRLTHTSQDVGCAVTQPFSTEDCCVLPLLELVLSSPDSSFRLQDRSRSPSPRSRFSSTYGTKARYLIGLFERKREKRGHLGKREELFSFGQEH